MDIKVVLLHWFINFLKKRSSGGGIENKNISNQKSAEELYKSIIRKFKKQKVHSFFIDNIQGADLAGMQLISKFNKGIRFLLCVIDVFSKYAWVVPLKAKEGITITNAFQNNLDQSNPKSKKIWANKESQFYNRSMESRLQNKDIDMYSTHNEIKSVVTKKFIRASNNKIYKYMTLVSKNMYVDKLNDLVNK